MLEPRHRDRFAQVILAILYYPVKMDDNYHPVIGYGWVAGSEYILKTENGGNDWYIQLKIDLDDKAGRFRDLKFLNENVGFAVGQKSFDREGILYQTINGGKNWQRIDDGNLTPLDEIYFVDDDYGWICGRGILLSTQDGGKSWHIDYFPEFLRYMQFTDREHGWISALDEAAVYRTADGGKTWVNIPNANRFYQFFNSFFFFNNNQGIASTFLGSKILTTEDGGLHWFYEDRLPSIRLNVMTFVNDSLGWAVGTNGAILQIRGSYFKTDNNVATTAALAGCYPNPFNNETTIYFYLSRPQKLTISIYNVLGKSVETFALLNSTKGMNEIKWQPQNIASGIYFIRIQCNEFTNVIKCMFNKF